MDNNCLDIFLDNALLDDIVPEIKVKSIINMEPTRHPPFMLRK